MAKPKVFVSYDHTEDALDKYLLQQISERGRAAEPIQRLVRVRREDDPAVDQLRQDLARNRRLPTEATAPVIRATSEILSQPSGPAGLPCLRCRRIDVGEQRHCWTGRQAGAKR